MAEIATVVRLLFAATFLSVVPPWLRRTVGGALVESIGVQLDAETDRNVDGVNLRFPSADRPTALGYLGRERRIIRGPAESDASYAARLLIWLDSHAIRGGPYALLTQLHAYFLDSMNVPIRLIASSGLRHSMDANGTIVRDTIDWNADGEYPNKWARIWLLFQINDTVIDVPLLDESGVPIVTEAGEPILTSVSIYALDDATKDILCAVPREWSAAHIDEIHIVLMPPGSELWGTPGIWDDTDPTPGQIWSSGNDAVSFLC